MMYKDLHHQLSQHLTALHMRIILLLAERQMTRTELYAQCDSYNNAYVKSACDFWKERGFITGGDSRGQTYRLTVKGASLRDWLQEGALIL